jgi:hypothetical protein
VICFPLSGNCQQSLKTFPVLTVRTSRRLSWTAHCCVSTVCLPAFKTATDFDNTDQWVSTCEPRTSVHPEGPQNYFIRGPRHYSNYPENSNNFAEILLLWPAHCYLLSCYIIIIIIIIQNMYRVTSWPQTALVAMLRKNSVKNIQRMTRESVVCRHLGQNRLCLTSRTQHPHLVDFLSNKVNYVPAHEGCSHNTRHSARLYKFQLSSQIKVVIQKLTVPQQAKKFSEFHGTRRFITVFTKSWVRLIHFNPPNPAS